MLYGLGVPHGFFTRLGGVSQGAYAQLNVGYGTQDKNDHIRENRRRAMHALLTDVVGQVETGAGAGAGTGAGAETPYPLWIPRQCHSSRVLVCEDMAMHAPKPWGDWQEAWHKGEAEADGMVSGYALRALGIVTADCVPMVCVDKAHKVFAVIHVGWRGARDGMIEAGLSTMVERGARVDSLHVALGPSIQKESYEVGAEFLGYFPDGKACFSRRDGTCDRYFFDLPAYIAMTLRALGVSAIDMLAHDTYREEAFFFSHRRAHKRGEGACGRQLTAMLCVV